MALFGPASLLDLSDDVLLLIFSYLKAWDLIHLAKTCERFSKVARDKSLWVEVDFSAGCLSLQQLRQWHTFLRPSTRRLILRGFKRRFAGTPRSKVPLISASFLKLLGEKCQELEELTFCEAFIDARRVKIHDFLPVKSIKKLSLVDCECVNLPSPVVEGSYFKRTHKILTNLQYLKITKCNWIDDYDLMVLSKIDTLKSLVLRNLPKVGRAMAYIALGFRFGFQNLEHLDLRGTSLEDNEVLSVVQNGKLQSLYVGPMGPIKRLSHDSVQDHNLVMPDPRWQEERHQVVVINVGPNGPHWQQVNDEELDGMGLQWVRNAPVVQHNRAEVVDEDRHYFIGRDGRPVEHEDDSDSQAGEGDEEEEEDDEEDDEEEEREEGRLQDVEDSKAHNFTCCNSEKRHLSSCKAKTSEPKQQKSDESKVSDGSLNERAKIDVNKEQSSKQKPVDDGEEENVNHVDNLQGCHQVINVNDNIDLVDEPYQEPDEGLSDNLVRALGQNTKVLHTLVLAGCAISDYGLQDIIRLVPSLRYLDVTNTKVTAAGVQEARVARPECVILGGGTRVVRHSDR
ncbi:leiomodin-3-like [Macrobrachium nipponense]|uniref:leiomodin-3-like n=1 Tax=Macrobrachium nipponense TaxID=159736 RepID=UPI0030C8D374